MNIYGFPYDHLEVLGKEELKSYTPKQTVRPTPHDPKECRFCQEMADDDLERKGVK